MLVEILSYHQVMPVYLDFISVFGKQSKSKDLRFSGFREQTTIGDPPRGPRAPSIGRSGRQYQLCYNLKCVTLKGEHETDLKLNEWSIQQAAIHHQFDIVEGTTLWMVTKGNLDIQQRFKELTGPNGRPEDKAFGTVYECFRSSLSAHLLYCHWSLDDWRGYIRYLEEVVENEVNHQEASWFFYKLILCTDRYGRPRSSRTRILTPAIPTSTYSGSAMVGGES